MKKLKNKRSKGTTAGVKRAKKKEVKPFWDGTWLQENATEWQKLLKLADWEIDFRWAEPGDMGGEKRIGECMPSLEHRGAIIRILHPSYYAPAGYRPPEPMDVEHTLVHELLHIPFAWCEGEGTRERDVEQAVNAIAHALITLKYGKKFAHIRKVSA